MINNETYVKMREMRLKHMAVILKDMCESSSYDEMTFEERMGILIDTEWDFRQTNKTVLLNKQAGFTQPQACLEKIDYLPERKLDRDKILRLGNCNYIKAKENIVLIGRTGVGKSYLSNALGNVACRKQHRVKYIRLQSMFDEISVARSCGDYRKTFKSFCRPALLVLDDFFLTTPKQSDVDCLLELVESRLYTGSTIYCSQLAPNEWHKRMGEMIVADSILDRIVNSAHIIEMQGDSMRKRYGTNSQ